MCISRGAAAFLALPPLPETALAPRDAYFARSEHVDVGAAEGRVVAETIVFYPPGIPVICTGEVFTEEVCRYIEAMAAAGLKVTGAADASLRTVRVIEPDLDEEEERGACRTRPPEGRGFR